MIQEKKKGGFPTKRVITAIIFIAITILAAIYGSWALTFYMVVLIVVGMKELTELFVAKNLKAAMWVVYLSNFALITVAYMNKK